MGCVSSMGPEAVYIGNLHYVFDGSEAWRNSYSSPSKASKNVWTLFLTTSPTGLVAPKSVKAVEYEMHSSYKQRFITTTEPPFLLVRAGWGRFTVRAKVTFKNGGEANFTHTLSNNNRLTITNPNGNFSSNAVAKYLRNQQYVVEPPVSSPDCLDLYNAKRIRVMWPARKDGREQAYEGARDYERDYHREPDDVNGQPSFKQVGGKDQFWFLRFDGQTWRIVTARGQLWSYWDKAKCHWVSEGRRAGFYDNVVIQIEERGHIRHKRAKKVKSKATRPKPGRTQDQAPGEPDQVQPG